MITRNDFKPGDIRPGVNMNGIFACELSRAEFLDKAFRLIGDLAFRGVEYLQIWLPWPLAEAGKYSEIMRNRMIFNCDKSEWLHTLNTDFFESELTPIIQFMLKAKITPVLNVGGYTRAQIKNPVQWPIKPKSAYGEDHIKMTRRLMAFIYECLGGANEMRKIIFKASNEPYAFPAPRNVSHKQAVEIIYKMVQFHARFKRDSMKAFNLSDENFAFDVTYGYDRETGKQWPIHNAGMTLGHCRKKYNVLEQSIGEIEDIEKKEVKMVDTWSIPEFHQCGDLQSISGRAGNMEKHQNFTGVMKPVDPGTGEKYIRHLKIAFVSADGTKPRLTGQVLSDCVFEIAMQSKKVNEDRALVHFSHPTAEYVIPSKDEYAHRWDFNKFDMENEVIPAIKGLLAAGIKLPNRGKEITPPAEPEKPVIPPPGPGVRPDEEKPPVKPISKWTLIGIGLALLAIIAGLVKMCG